MKRLRDLLEMIRFSHTLFALPFALLAGVMAWSAPSATGATVPFRLRDLAGILICMVAARSAAMAFNRLVDRDFDAVNPRTAGRHLPAGILSARSVVIFTVACVVVFQLATLLFLPNPLPPILALPVMAVLLAYSYTKRFTMLAHFWLGASLMLAPVCAWLAIRGSLVLQHPSDLAAPLWLGLAVLVWVAGFDLIYACQDVEADRSANLHSIPARWGVAAALRISAVCHAVTVLLLASMPCLFPHLGLGWTFAGAVGIVALLLAYGHLIVSPRDLTRVNIAFFYVNVGVSLSLLAVGTLDLLLW